MKIRFAHPDEIAQWDTLLSSNPDGGNVFASRALAETKRLGGWKPRYLLCDNLAITVLEKYVPLLGHYWYLPKGPGVDSVEAMLELMPELRTFAATQKVFAIKIEPEIIETEEAQRSLVDAGLIHTNAIQPNVSTVIIDLKPTLEDIMKNFNQKGRHAIHRAERDGATAKSVPLTDENMRHMYDLLCDTAAGRFESSVRTFEYYHEFWTRFAKDDHGALFFTYVDGKIVAGAYCLYLGNKGLYKDGASVRERTVYGASHLLQWEVIQWMKAHDVASYDLCGAPHSSHINDEAGSFYGIGRFKTSFNKRVTDYVGCYDVVVRPRAYDVWQRLGLRLALSLSYRFKHDQWF